jgi:hypothetical protein
MSDVVDPYSPVTLDRKTYEQLVLDSRILHALYAGGVDNWEWYDESLRDLRGEDDDEESYEDIYGEKDE